MADRVIGWAYGVFALGIVVAAVFGPDAPLSIGWMGTIAGSIVEGLWQGSPGLCLLGIFAGGCAVGYRVAMRELTQPPQFTPWGHARNAALTEGQGLVSVPPTQSPDE